MTPPSWSSDLGRDEDTPRRDWLWDIYRRCDEEDRQRDQCVGAIKNPVCAEDDRPDIDEFAAAQARAEVEGYDRD